MEHLQQISIVASIISFDLFTEIQPFYNGSIAAHEKISLLAHEFVQEHEHIENWEKYCEDNNLSDWTEAILKWTKKELNK
jgi:hypothetical protein